VILEFACVSSIIRTVAAYIIRTLTICSNNTQHEHNEHLTLNMLRILIVDNVIFAMGSAKNRIVHYGFAKGSIQDYGYISIAYVTAVTSSAQGAADNDI
jgi:hypothetical protein